MKKEKSKNWVVEHAPIQRAGEKKGPERETDTVKQEDRE